MDDLMLWILSNGGLGIFFSLLVAFFLFLCLLSDECGCHNNPMIAIPMILILGAFICGLVGFYIYVDNINAPVSWFRDLPVGEIDGMKNIMSKHDKPLTIYQFYEAKLSVQKENHRQEQLDAMKGIKK